MNGLFFPAKIESVLTNASFYKMKSKVRSFEIENNDERWNSPLNFQYKTLGVDLLLRTLIDLGSLFQCGYGCDCLLIGRDINYNMGIHCRTGFEDFSIIPHRWLVFQQICLFDSLPLYNCSGYLQLVRHLTNTVSLLG